MSESDRVRCSWPAKLFVALWTPVITAIGLGLLLSIDVHPERVWPGYAHVLDATLPWLTLALMSLFWWRFTGVCATRNRDGLRVRGMWWTHQIRWADLLEVTSTESGSWQILPRVFVISLSRTALTYRHPNGYSREKVIVSRSFRTGSAGRDTILSWLPTDHPLRPSLPTRPPAPVRELDRASWRRLPVRGEFPAKAYDRALFLLLVVFLTTTAIVLACISMPPYETTIWWSVTVAALIGLVVVAAWIAQRISRSRTVVTDAGLIDHGVFGTGIYPIAEIRGFGTSINNHGVTTRVVLWGRGSRPLAGAHPAPDGADDFAEILDHWLRSGGRLSVDGPPLAQ